MRQQESNQNGFLTVYDLVDGKETEFALDYALDTLSEVFAEKKICRVRYAPDGTELDFTQENGTVKFNVPFFENHAMITLE